MPNVFVVFKLINEYLQAAAGRSGRIRLIELADGGMLKLAAVARRGVIWHLGLEDLVLIAFDIENQGRSALLGKKQLSKGETDLQHYLGRSKYDFAEYIALVECSCNDDVRRKFLSSKLTTTLGGVVTRWKTDDRTKRLRLLVVLALGGCCRALDQPQRVPRHENIDAERVSRYFCQLVRRLEQNPDADLRLIEPECPRDTTLDLETGGVRNQLNVAGFARISSPLLEIPAISSRAPMLIENRFALIVVAQISLLRLIREGVPRMPHVMSMVLANGLVSLFAVFDSDPQEAVVPPGVIDFGNRHEPSHPGEPRQQQRACGL